MPDSCRLGYEEHDGTRYCFEHGDFALWAAGRSSCETRRAQLRADPVAVPSAEDSHP